MRDIVLAAPLELLEQPAESAVENGSGGGAAKDSAQCATQQVAQTAAAGGAALSAWHPGPDVTARGPGRLGRRRAGAAHVLRGVDRKESQQRLGRRRHALACRRSLPARIVGDTTGLNTVENIEQAHISLLTCPNPAQHRARMRRLQGQPLIKDCCDSEVLDR